MQEIKKGLSIVIPVKNEEDSIEPIVEEIVSVGLDKKFDLEIVFIDDGSTDSTLNKILSLKQKYNFINVYKMKYNIGKSGAWHLGFSMAQKEIIVTMDGDLQNDPNDIYPLMTKLEEGYDLVSGRRRKRADTISRKIQSRIANNVRQFFLKDGANDSGCGIKMFRKSCLPKIVMFHGCHRFWEALFKMNDFKLTQILVNDRQRKFGVPKYGLKNRLIRPFIDMLGVFWIRRRTVIYEYTPIKNNAEKNEFQSSKNVYPK